MVSAIPVRPIDDYLKPKKNAFLLSIIISVAVPCNKGCQSAEAFYAGMVHWPAVGHFPGFAMTSSGSIVSRETCLARDTSDPLGASRDRFVIRQGLIYLDGNSLGPMPRAAAGVLSRTIEQEWGQDLIKSWNSAGWFEMPLRLGDRIGALTGAAPGRPWFATPPRSISTRPFTAALGLRPDRHVVIAEAASFPTDLYIIEGAMASAGRPMQRRLIGADGPSVEALLDEKVAVVVLSHVDYRTGALLDVAAITEQVHKAGALVVWDLCHSAGVIEFGFDRHAIDFAVGCTYKYLNGGPGSPAFISVAKAHQAAARHPLSGWWGHAAPFAFDRDFQPDAGIKRFLCGTPPIISLRGVDAALDALEGVEVAALRKKSLALTELFMGAWSARCCPVSTSSLSRARAARQSGRDRFRQRLFGGAGDDRTRRGRRFSSARHHAFWFRAALSAIPGCLGCRRNTCRVHPYRGVA